MSLAAFVDTAKVMFKGQVTIPKDVRTVLGISNGDRVTFVVEGNMNENFNRHKRLNSPYLQSYYKHSLLLTL